MYVFKRFFKFSILIIDFVVIFLVFLVWRLTTGDAAARSVHEERGSTVAMDCFVVSESAPHRGVAEDRRLYPNTLDARRFGTMFSDGRSSTMLDRIVVRCDSYIGA